MTTPQKQLNKIISTEQIEKRLKSILSSADPLTKKMINHAKTAKGKRLRAKVALLSASMFGRVTSKVTKLATALELFHHATLIHDDIIDHASVRRKQPTMNHVFGNEAAVMVGDYLLTQVMQLVVQSMPAPVQKVIAQAASNVCLGEIQEIGARSQSGMDEKTYYEIISNKTASLFAAACQGGALLNGASAGEAKKMNQIGHAMGQAFQIQDDLLDLTGKSNVLGKSSGTDLKEGYQTLPVILGLKRSSPTKRHQLKTYLRHSDKHSHDILIILEACGALDEARSQANGFADKAIKKIERFNDSSARRSLIDLIYFSVERKA